MISTATYRIQLNYRFNFKNVLSLLDYFKDLGISHIYVSPITQANQKSLHGYDVIDPLHVNKELGGAKLFFSFAKTLKKNKLGIILDIVPNHMAANFSNQWWRDVVLKKKRSRFASFFDIDWVKSTDEALVYRRFFDINELVCMQMENNTVFNITHQLIFKLLSKQLIDGLRVDHIDGLRRPLEYLFKLRKTTGNDFFIIVEKILAKNEKIPSEWPVNGTTGYDFLNELNKLFVEPIGLKEITKNYYSLIKNNKSIEDVRYETNKWIIQHLFNKEFSNALTHLQSIANSCSAQSDHDQLALNLLEITTCIPIYRTYIDNQNFSLRDQEIIARTIRLAMRRNSALNKDRLKLIKKVFFNAKLFPYKRLNFIYNWQVLTAPMIAKSFEDTVCYNFNPLLSLNEVGSSPGFFEFIDNLDSFHAYNKYKQSRQPLSLNTTSTHDTKRSEDVRARINVLSEIPKEWSNQLAKWIRWNNSQKIVINNKPAPDANEEIFIYQTLIGAWPLNRSEQNHFKKRLKNYLIKATREAKIHSNWASPNSAYEQALQKFCDRILSNKNTNHFLSDFLKFQEMIAFHGMLNSLSQLLLKITSPGIPDFYQGNEIWRFDLVDPDNRRPIDYKSLLRLMHELQNEKNIALAELLSHWKNGKIKLFLIKKMNHLRRHRSELFNQGSYIPLMIVGKKAKNAVGFLRKKGKQIALIVVPRYSIKLTQINKFPTGASVWGDTRILLPNNMKKIKLISIFSNENIASIKTRGNHFIYLSAILKQFPVGVIISD